MDNSFIQSFLIALFAGLASGAVGAFVILKRMALVGDAFSHVALPGIALAVAYNLDPFWGVVVTSLLTAFIVFKLEQKTQLSVETLVGLLFTASLAIGILTIPDHEVIEALFGAFPVLPLSELLVILGMAILATVSCFVLTRRFVFTMIASDIARIHGIKPAQNFFFLLIFAIVVALGIKLVGALLMGALTIIPAAIARNISRSIRSYIVLSTFLGGFISVVGVWLAVIFNWLPGPVIIIFGIMIFIISLFFVKKN